MSKPFEDGISNCWQLSRPVRQLSEFDGSAIPLVGCHNRHYKKVLLKTRRGSMDLGKASH